MNKVFSLIILFSVAIPLLGSQAYARDSRLQFPINDVLTSKDAEKKLSGKVQFFFGDQPYGNISESFGIYTSNKKTNAFNKTDKKACERAMLSALISLDQRARKEGGNAVINITSEYRNNSFKSNTEYECGAGNIIAGVTLQGNVVKLLPRQQQRIQSHLEKMTSPEPYPVQLVLNQ